MNGQSESDAAGRRLVHLTLRARDVAYLAAVIERNDLPYPRKADVAEDIQRLWREASSSRDPFVVFAVTTSHAEAAGRAAEEKAEQEEPR